MFYDRSHIYVVAGKPVEVVYQNTDIMPHNLIIAAPGAREEVGILAERMGATPAGFAKQVVLETPQVFHAPACLNRASCTVCR